VTAVRLVGVARRYETTSGAVDALRAIDLSIDSGEAVAIVGPSGCGKSTLLGLIGGLERPTAGTVVVGMVDLATLDDAAATKFRRTTVGLVFQSTDLMPFLTALENVDLALALNGRADHGAARRLLEQLDLGAHVDKLPDQLSGGQRQRVGIARAIAHRPALILADEPTGELDSAASRTTIELLQRVHVEIGATLIVVTHDEGVAERLGRTVRLRDGVIVEDSGRRSAREAAVVRV
jgi:putative ABC transport system ATP-binding protein